MYEWSSRERRNKAMIEELRAQLRLLRNGEHPMIPAGDDIPDVLLDFRGTLKAFHTERFPPCVYFLCLGNEVVYVGQSIALHGRVHEHGHSITFDRVFYMPVLDADVQNILFVESAFIRMLNPKHNRSKGVRIQEIAQILIPYGLPEGATQ